MENSLFGKLTLDALPHHWYTVGGTAFVVMMIIIIAMILTKTKRWSWLWQEWLTSTDPKKIGTMYMLFASLMFFRGIVDAGMI
ncbi:MAG: cytochrome o ubiquinol oxidase subunit I, partial [Anaerolineae bacterium]